MGLDLVHATLAIRRGREPDWQAAAKAIDFLEFATVWNTGDAFFNVDEWQDDADTAVPLALGFYAVLRGAQEHLRECARIARSAIEDERWREATLVELPHHRAWITGEANGGEEMHQTYEAFACLGEAGVARAAGFDYWTKCCLIPLEDRAMRTFDANERRRYRAVRALMYAEDAVDADVGPARTLEPKDWAKHLRETLSDLERVSEDDAGRGLMGLLVRILALSRAADAPDEKYGHMRACVRALDRSCPRRRALGPARRDISARIASQAGHIEHLASAGSKSRGWSGGPLAAELTTHLVGTVAYAIADLYPDKLAELLPLASPEVKAYAKQPACAIEGRMTWVALDPKTWNHAMARRAIEGAPLTDRWDLYQRFGDLNGYIGGIYSRTISFDEFGGIELWQTVESEKATFDEAVTTLGRAGILEAAGVLSWGTNGKLGGSVLA